MSKSVKKGEQVLRLENIQAISLLSVQLIRSLGLELLGIRGQDVIITSILLQKDLDIVLPVMEVHIDGIQCTAVMGTSCSHTLMSSLSSLEEEGGHGAHSRHKKPKMLWRCDFSLE